MKKNENKYSKYLGKEIIVETEKGVKIPCFVAGIDKEKGISIKPLNPEEFSADKIGYNLIEGNLLCLNMSTLTCSNIPVLTVFEYLKNRIARGSFNLKTHRKWAKKNSGTFGFKGSPCAFK